MYTSSLLYERAIARSNTAFTSTARSRNTHQGQPNTRTLPMANQLPPGQQQIYDHFDTESSYSLDDLAEAFLQYSKRDIGRFLARLRGRGFLRY